MEATATTAATDVQLQVQMATLRKVLDVQADQFDQLIEPIKAVPPSPPPADPNRGHELDVRA